MDIDMDTAEMHIDVKELGYPKSDIGTKFNQKSFRMPGAAILSLISEVLISGWVL
jgi:hypothetical protein